MRSEVKEIVFRHFILGICEVLSLSLDTSHSKKTKILKDFGNFTERDLKEIAKVTEVEISCEPLRT